MIQLIWNYFHKYYKCTFMTSLNKLIGAQSPAGSLQKTHTQFYQLFFLARYVLPHNCFNRGEAMVHEARCIKCGLTIEKDYILFINGTEFTFDSFECAVNFVAPRCANCNSVILKDGIQISEAKYCNHFCFLEKESSLQLN